jgi:glycosyltransferase involved in cell wall biosynthesis
MLKVTYFYREPRKTGLSIEGIFHAVKKCLDGRVEIKEFYCDAHASRFKNVLEAKKHSSEINHITGDVHFMALGLRGKKNILTIHDLGHHDTLKSRNHLHFFIYKLFWYYLPLRYIDVITVISVFTKNALIEHFHLPENRIRVIYDPVKPVFRFSIRQQTNGVPHILQVGTGKHKNLNNLVEAVKDMNVHLDIVGWPAEDVVGKMTQYGISYSIYNGLSEDELYQRYVACDLLFFASFIEGFGMPIIEAQATGRPVITSDRGAMKEIAADTAVLVDPENVSDIRQAIISLTTNNDLYEKLVKKGRENVIKFDCEKIAKEYLTVYEELHNS